MTTDAVFSGSIPSLYDKYLGPLIFEPYAQDLGNRLSVLHAERVLETAAGTGIVTRALERSLSPRGSIVATDLNQPMLDHAAERLPSSRVSWQKADAQALPFPDATFDAVTCQFGVMFFPDKARAFSEARRVLRPGGVLLFSVWDRIEENEFADAVTTALESLFPQDPPRFLARTPHGYHDLALVRKDLQGGGFVSPPQIDTVAARSKAASPRIPALAYCQGTPLRSEIEARDSARLAEATDFASAAVARRFGPAAVDSKIQAHIVAIER